MNVTMNSMRTTVELTNDHRTALLALASRRGQEWLSELVAEAIEEYLRRTACELRESWR